MSEENKLHLCGVCESGMVVMCQAEEDHLSYTLCYFSKQAPIKFMPGRTIIECTRFRGNK